MKFTQRKTSNWHLAQCQALENAEKSRPNLKTDKTPLMTLSKKKSSKEKKESKTSWISKSNSKNTNKNSQH
jgi:hypothetical protein